MFSLVAVSFDRCWAVCYPVTYHVRGTATTKVIILFCWVFGIVFGFLPALGWNSGRFDNKCDLRVIADLNYLFFICVVIAFMSTVAILVLYLLIYCAVLRQVEYKAEVINEDINEALSKCYRPGRDRPLWQILWNRQSIATKFERPTLWQ